MSTKIQEKKKIRMQIEKTTFLDGKGVKIEKWGPGLDNETDVTDDRNPGTFLKYRWIPRLNQMETEQEVPDENTSVDHNIRSNEVEDEIKSNEANSEVSDLELDVNLNENKSHSNELESPESPDELAMAVEVAKTETELSKKDLDRKLKEFGEYDPKLDLSEYKLPNIDLLEEHGSGNISVDKDELEGNKNKIIETLLNYKYFKNKTTGPQLLL